MFFSKLISLLKYLDFTQGSPFKIVCFSTYFTKFKAALIYKFQHSPNVKEGVKKMNIPQCKTMSIIFTSETTMFLYLQWLFIFSKKKK